MFRPALEAKALDRYFALRPAVDRAAFMRSYAGLAALNEARILGIFARLIVRDGKPRYAAFMPRMWAHLNANLKQPGLETVAVLVRQIRPRGDAANDRRSEDRDGAGRRPRHPDAPLTDDRPKALVEVGGKALIDHTLDRLAEAGVERAVVNVHAFADRLIAHLATRYVGPLEIVISDEREPPCRWRPAAGSRRRRPVWATRRSSSPISTASGSRTTRPATAINLCAGFESRADELPRCCWPIWRERPASTGDGDFIPGRRRAADVPRRRRAASAPLNYMGVHIVDPARSMRIPRPSSACSRLAAACGAAGRRGRLYGHVMEGDWMHVGDPAARDVAEARLADWSE
jgi:MurNAc alpha-1-phosphate uridylyltransferase